MNSDYLKTVLNIKSLAVFGSLKEDPVIGGLCDLLYALYCASPAGSLAEDKRTPETDAVKISELYSEVISNLYPVSSDLGDYIRRAVLSDDNFYVEAVACGDDVGDEIRTAAKRELVSLQELAELSSKDIRSSIANICSSPEDDHDLRKAADAVLSMPSWSNSRINLLQSFMAKMNDMSTTGYGIFAEHDFFRISGSEIVPVPHPDVQPLSQLFGYRKQKDLIIRNTEALLRSSPSSAAGRVSNSPASNILLYGDAGTGKSSTVKAVAFAYAEKGLRLIELKKEQLHLIPTILDRIHRQPLKFILFIDDLSFSGNDDNFSALKAILEGSITGRGENAVIYATSNRRHLIKESFSDRDGDDLHVNDTLQESMSLAARFGLTVMFENSDKDEYLDIVRNLAEANGIDIPEDELFKKAEAHAIRRNGRSPRTARQFVELLRVELIQ